MIRHLAFILLYISGVLSSCKNPNHLRIGDGKSPSKSLLTNLTITKVINVIKHPEWSEDKWSLGNCGLLCNVDWECRAFDWHLIDRVCTLGSAFNLTDTEDPLVANYMKVFGPSFNSTDPEGAYCYSDEEMDRWIDTLLGKTRQPSTQLQLFSPTSKDSNMCPADSVSVLQIEMINRSHFIHKNLNITDPINETSHMHLDEDKWYIGNCSQMCDANWECRAFEWHRENRTCKLGRAFVVNSELEDGSVFHYKRLFGEFVDNHQEEGSSCRKAETLFEWVKQLKGDDGMQTTPSLSSTSSVESLSSTSRGAEVGDSSSTSSLAGDGSSSTEGQTEEGKKETGEGKTTSIKDQSPTEAATPSTEAFHPTTTTKEQTTPPATYDFHNMNVSREVKCNDTPVPQCSCPHGKYIIVNSSSDWYIGAKAQFEYGSWAVYSESGRDMIIENAEKMECVVISAYFAKNACRIPVVKNANFGENDIRCSAGVTPTVFTSNGRCSNMSVLNCAEGRGFYCGDLPVEIYRVTCSH